MVNQAAHRRYAVNYPAWFSERSDEEANAFLERDVDPLDHSVVVDLRRRLDERVHPDRLVGQRPDELESLPEVVPMHICQRHGLHDAERTGIGGRCHELGVRARVHRAADERQSDPCVVGQLRVRGHAPAACGFVGPNRQSALAVATMSPASSTILASTA